MRVKVHASQTETPKIGIPRRQPSRTKGVAYQTFHGGHTKASRRCSTNRSLILRSPAECRCSRSDPTLPTHCLTIVTVRTNVTLDAATALTVALTSGPGSSTGLQSSVDTGKMWALCVFPTQVTLNLPVKTSGWRGAMSLSKY